MPATTLAPRLPVLVGERVTVRPGTPEDVAPLHAIWSEPSVMQGWGKPDSPDTIAASLRGEGDTVLLVIVVNHAVVGAIQYYEEDDPMYRHAGIDIYLSGANQGRGLGSEAMRLMIRFLLDERGHHRLIIDPANANTRAIKCYQSVGFRPVGVMRQYQRNTDGVFIDSLLMDLLASECEARPPM